MGASAGTPIGGTETGREFSRVLLNDELELDVKMARQDNVEETWRIVQPLLDSPPPLEAYEQGTWGPPSAEAMAQEHGGWRTPQPA